MPNGGYCVLYQFWNYWGIFWDVSQFYLGNLLSHDVCRLMVHEWKYLMGYYQQYYLLRWSEHGWIFTDHEPEANNCFNIIFRGEYQELQNNGLKQKNKDAIVRAHADMQP